MREAALGAKADVDASSYKASLAARLCHVDGVLEADQVRLRLVDRDGDLPSLQLELSGEEVGDVACSDVTCQMECPQDKGVGFPVPHIVLETK